MEYIDQSLTSKNPIDYRILFFCLSGMFFTLHSFVLSAQAENTPLGKTLHEKDVIQWACKHSSSSAVAKATEELADSRARTSGLLLNPSLQWARETVGTGPKNGQGSQDILSVTVPIDIARPWFTRSLAASENSWLKSQASFMRTEAVLQLVRSYYDVVFSKKHLEICAKSVAHLEEIERIVSRREAEGLVSGYESMRLAIATELIRSRFAEAQGIFASAKEKLSALLNVSSNTFEVDTNLTLISQDKVNQLLQKENHQLRMLQHAEISKEHAVIAEERAQWTWLPMIELGGGMKRANNMGSANGFGYAVQASLSIPFFDYGQAHRAEAESHRELTDARSEVLIRDTQSKTQSATAQFIATTKALEQLEMHTSDQVQKLLQAASSGYREGERSLVELLDAQSAQTEVEQRRLELLRAAKWAEAQLRAARGDFE